MRVAAAEKAAQEANSAEYPNRSISTSASSGPIAPASGELMDRNPVPSPRRFSGTRLCPAASTAVLDAPNMKPCTKRTANSVPRLLVRK